MGNKTEYTSPSCAQVKNGHMSHVSLMTSWIEYFEP
jgi:hypothetical protein